MTESNHCAENALAERMNGILKQEYGLGLEFGIKADARRAWIRACGSTTHSGHTPRWATRPRRRCIRWDSIRTTGGVAQKFAAPVGEWRAKGLYPKRRRRSPCTPLRNARRLGPQAHDRSRELEFGDRLLSALPQSPTIPSSRFADR